MNKNSVKIFFALLLALASLMTACNKNEADINTEITPSESSSGAETEKSSFTENAAAETSTEADFGNSTQTNVPEKTTATEDVNEALESTPAAVSETYTETLTCESVHSIAPEIKTEKTEEAGTNGKIPAEAVLDSALSLHELRKDKDKEINLNVDRPSFIEGASNGGWFYAFEYNGTEYECADHCTFISDESKNVTFLESFYYSPNEIMAKLNEFEYLGTIGKTDLGAAYFDEADVYQYDNKLLLIYNDDNYPLYVWDFRSDYFGFSDSENISIGNDLDKLKEALSNKNFNYDPDVFLCALLYEKGNRNTSVLP